MKLTRKGAIIAGLVVVLVLSGCLSMTVEIDVNDEGELDRMEAVLVMDEFLFDMLEDEAQADGYESFEESIMEQEDETAWDRFDYEEVREDGEVIVTITAYDGNPAELDTIDVTVDEDHVTFVEEDTFDLDSEEFDDFSDQIEMEYTVNMPGDIVEEETNGNVIDDRTVQWNHQDHGGLQTFEATSNRAPDDSPGFGMAIAIVTILGLTIYVARRRRR